MAHDAIVVGAGHNGLICAAYLARAGLAVLVLEARPTVGGCASTVDALGARINICNCDHVTIRAAPVIEELDLAGHGLRYLDLDPHLLALGWDGQEPWFGFHDVERTLESIAVAHPGEVDGYRRYLRHALPAVHLLLAVTQTVPTPRRVIARIFDRRGRGASTLLRWSRLSAEAVLRTFFSSEALVAPAIAIGPAVWGSSPGAPHTGLGALSYAMRHVVPTGRPVGGSGALPQAAAAVVEAHRGEIRCDTRVAGIVVDGARARGVRLADGEVVEAPIVVSAVDPRRTLGTWVNGHPRRARSLVRRWRAQPERSGYQSKIDAIVTRLPRYRAVDDAVAARHGVDEPMLPTAHICPPVGELTAAHGLLKRGRVAERPLFNVNFPSVPDATLRAGSGHVMSLEVLFTPYRLEGGWAGSTEPSRWLARFGEHLEPGFSESVERWRVVTPVDYETGFGLANGYAPSYGRGPMAAMLGRDRELTRYRTPIAGLYLTGAGTFPGSGVWGASGRNTAGVVLAAT